MPKPKPDDTEDRMSPEDVEAWLVEIKERGLAAKDGDAAVLIGKSHDTLTRMRKLGADRTTALACNAALHRLPPFAGGLASKRSFTVTMPLTVTVEAEGYDGDAIRATLAGMLGAPKNQVKVS